MYIIQINQSIVDGVRRGKGKKKKEDITCSFYIYDKSVDDTTNQYQ